MKIIRTGTYTIYKELEMAIYDYYGHGMDEQVALNYKLLMYFGQENLEPEFSSNPQLGCQQKEIKLSELTNAYKVRTFASFEGQTFMVYPQNFDENIIRIATYEQSFEKNNKWFQMHDSDGKSYFMNDIPTELIEKIWEERGQSDLNLPMPVTIQKVFSLK